MSGPWLEHLQGPKSVMPNEYPTRNTMKKEVHDRMQRLNTFRIESNTKSMHNGALKTQIDTDQAQP
jgi:hypothetical protein